jgi:energy-coupling factor transporter ATP-binding protein EcfA2
LRVNVIELRGAVVAYDERPVLRGVDLTVSTGEVVAILGANGSGKSTLVRAVLGLVPLVAGSVRLFGADRSPGRCAGASATSRNASARAAECRRPCRRSSPRDGWPAAGCDPYGGVTATRSTPPSPRSAWPTAPRRR